MLAAVSGSAARGRCRSTQPPSGRVKKPSSSVSEPAAADAPCECPCFCKSVTTQLPATTLKPNDAV